MWDHQASRSEKLIPDNLEIIRVALQDICLMIKEYAVKMAISTSTSLFIEVYQVQLLYCNIIPLA